MSKLLSLILFILIGSSQTFAGGLTCFTDKGVIKITSHVELPVFWKTAEFVAEGVIEIRNDSELPDQDVNFKLDVKAEATDSGKRIKTNIQVTNPYLQQDEFFTQDFLSYIEFHLLKNQLQPQGSTGFVSTLEAYGFGVQCFLG